MEEIPPGTGKQPRSSRIFVRNLPLSRFSEADLRKHFSKISEVTDCRFFPDRRIAFIGYRKPEDAEAAADYFNNSYIRTAKLGVDVAKSVKDEYSKSSRGGRTVGNKPQSQTSDDLSSRKNLKRKRNPPENANEAEKPVDMDNDSNLQEYLALNQPLSKSKTWADKFTREQETQTLENLPKPEENEEEEKDDVNDSNDEVMQDLSKRRSRKRKPEIIEPENEILLDNPSTSAENNHHDSPILENEKNDNEGTDADWLRSKTNRLLDLVTEDEDYRLPAAVSETSAQPIVEDTDMVDANEVQEPSSDSNQAWEVEEEETEDTLAENSILETGRLFLRNLFYSCTEEDITELFEPFGDIEEVHLAVDQKTNKSKGIAHVLFSDPTNAVDAFKALDRQIFQGRTLHIIPGQAKRQQQLDDVALSKLPLKKQREILKKRGSARSDFEWNSLYMNIDAVMSSMANRLGVDKAELLDPTSADATIQQAHAETQIIQDTKTYFESHGVDLSAFSRKQRGDKVLLIKNFPFGTTTDELRTLLAQYGDVLRVLMPPTGTIAIAEFINDTSGRSAFTKLYGRKFKDSMLKVEKGPKDLFTKGVDATVESKEDKAKEAGLTGTDLLQTADENDITDTASLFIKNLNFSTTSLDLKDLFSPLGGFVSARVQTKTDAKKPSQTLSMGFGFVEFRTKEDADRAQKGLSGYNLQGHKIEIRPSRKGEDAANEQRKKDLAKKNKNKQTKIVIKNLAFEVTEKQIRQLFSKYGKLRSVRLPKKFNNTTRGYGFAEFISIREAENAMAALKHTHVHGRPLVLEWAKEDSKSAEEEIQRLTNKVKNQVHSVNMAKLSGSKGRKKFDLEGDQDEDL